MNWKKNEEARSEKSELSFEERAKISCLNDITIICKKCGNCED